MTTRQNIGDRTFRTGEAAELTDTSPIQIEFWCKSGLLQPHQSGTGRGFHRSLTVDDLVAIIIIRELTNAGLSVPQLQQLFVVLRAKLAATPKFFRSAALFHDYIQTVKVLAKTFGKGDGYDRWLTEANACLVRLKREATAPRASNKAETTHEGVDARLRQLLATVSRLPGNGLSVRASVAPDHAV